MMIIGNSDNSSQTDQFSSMLKKITIIEKEIFDLHKKQRIKFTQWKNKEGPTVEINNDMV